MLQRKDRSPRHRPQQQTGSAKYGQKAAGTISLGHHNLPEAVMKDLQVAASHSLAVRTWESYKTAERMLAKYMRSTGKTLKLPVDESTILGFIHWLAFSRGLKATSISGYLSGVRNLHIIKGAPEPKIRTEIVAMVLEGKKNMDAAERLRGPQHERQPVTLDIMKLLKAQIKKWEATYKNKLTAWLICTLLFHAACRGGELLCRTSSTFDPTVNLLRKDICLVEGQGTAGAAVLQLKLKNPKECKDNRAIIVDIFESGSQICPVQAYKKWDRSTTGEDMDMPAFTWDNGRPVTTNAMNNLLKGWLDEYLPNHRISVHSFRTGTASLMGELGYSDKDIQAVGRWSSRAFENYIKLPRTKRLQTLRKLEKNKTWLK